MKKVILLVGFSLLLISLITFFPFLYNYHFFSLARLKNSIEIGDSYTEVEKKFKDYEEKNIGDSELDVVISKTELFIYHVNIFDDCQLTVLFNSNNMVKEVKYIWD